MRCESLSACVFVIVWQFFIGFQLNSSVLQLLAIFLIAASLVHLQNFKFAAIEIKYSKCKSLQWCSLLTQSPYRYVWLFVVFHSICNLLFFCLLYFNFKKICNKIRHYSHVVNQFVTIEKCFFSHSNKTNMYNSVGSVGL